ncbi:MAG: hypothetical protein J7K08_01285 [Thermoplasmata archaeon]|mgnify:CR=1 FL=1|nr:hypothetical protein [Thermoplasmata archaeon]RLF54143.1 MAG: hypothetical protein DRN28_05870 [Thermoplasmata archaeon]RLF68262.1 MAG: hypothetical protein DRN40_07820 [Thermoplasmata archaeon]RLF71959.1 MAG: hypothetical protein DRN55_06795 [Thermoplasmata archaeon]HDD60773.1 hypothetical protein [Euryarchaeota archaeon]
MADAARILLSYHTLPVRIFYLTLITVLLVSLMIGLWVVGAAENTAGMLMGLGEALIGFSAAIYMVFKYRDEIQDVEDLVGPA